MTLRDDLSKKLITFAITQRQEDDLDKRIENLDYMVGWIVERVQQEYIRKPTTASDAWELQDWCVDQALNHLPHDEDDE